MKDKPNKTADKGRASTPGSRSSDYVPYGPEWEAEMMKNRKADIVKMLRRAIMENLGPIPISIKTPEEKNTEKLVKMIKAIVQCHAERTSLEADLKRVRDTKDSYQPAWREAETRLIQGLEAIKRITLQLMPPKCGDFRERLEKLIADRGETKVMEALMMARTSPKTLEDCLSDIPENDPGMARRPNQNRKSDS